jgi:transposase
MSTDAIPAGTDAIPLPDDPVLLQQMIRELLASNHALQRRAEQVEYRLDQLLRRLYGPRAERYDPNQPVLFAEMTAAATPAEPAPSSEPEPVTPAKRSNGHGRRELPKNLPRRQMVHDLAAAERTCPGCGRERSRIGEEVSEQLDYRPARLFVVEHIRAKYACSHCQEHVSIATKPLQPIDKGLPGPGLLAHVAVSKYGDHLPLYRLERIFSRHGVELSRTTLCGWMAACAARLTPLYQLMIQRVLNSKVIHTDDTPIPVLDPDQDQTKTGRMWTYLGDGHHPYTIFAYTPNRKRDGPAEFLKNFSGYLQADAFAGYDGIYATQAVTEVACWAHARRKFYDARTTNAALAHEALARIRQLYDLEHQAKELPASKRALLRQQEARPLLDSFAAWLDQQRQTALPKSPIGQAIAYARSNWEALVRYTDDGDLSIDNNAAERAIRPIAIGRKNWLFAGSDNGGQTAAILFSFIASCQRAKLEPFAYLRDVLTAIATYPAERLEELLPDRWLLSRLPTPANIPAAEV